MEFLLLQTRIMEIWKWTKRSAILLVALGGVVLYVQRDHYETVTVAQEAVLKGQAEEIAHLTEKIRNISNAKVHLKLEQKVGFDYFAYFEMRTDDPDFHGYGYNTNLKIDQSHFRKIVKACELNNIPVEWVVKRLFYESRLGANSRISPTNDGSMFQINKSVLNARGYSLTDVESNFDLALEMFIWYYDSVLRKYKPEFHTDIYKLGETKFMQYLDKSGIDRNTVYLQPRVKKLKS